MTFSQKAPVKNLSINCCIEMFYEKFEMALKLEIIDEILRHCSGFFQQNCEQKMMTLRNQIRLWFVFVCRDSVISTTIHDGSCSKWYNWYFNVTSRSQNSLNKWEFIGIIGKTFTTLAGVISRSIKQFVFSISFPTGGEKSIKNDMWLCILNPHIFMNFLF